MVLVRQEFSRSSITLCMLTGPCCLDQRAELAMVDMKNSTHLVAPHAAHGVAMQSCANRIVAQLVEEGSIAQLEDDCLKKGQARSFYLNANGIDIVMPSTEQKTTSEEAL